MPSHSTGLEIRVTSRSCSTTPGIGRNNSPLTTLKTVTLAQIPSARQNTATAVKPALLFSLRRPYRTSRGTFTISRLVPDAHKD